MRAYKTVLFLAVAIVLSGTATYLGLGDILRESQKPSEFIGLAFSILAASLFAVVSIVGDPSMLLSNSWKGAWTKAKLIQVRLLKLIYLFVVYLVVLFLLVVTEIVEHLQLVHWYFIHDVFAFLVSFAFLLSLRLPFEIKEIQIERMENEIAARKSSKK